MFGVSVKYIVGWIKVLEFYGLLRISEIWGIIRGGKEWLEMLC